jgi:hypothetical protein
VYKVALSVHYLFHLSLTWASELRSCTAELTRFEHEEKELSKDQRRRVQDANERLGYHDSGIIVVIGEGWVTLCSQLPRSSRNWNLRRPHRGSARVAYQVLANSFSPSSILHKEGQQRVLVVTPDDKWNHTFYDVEEGNHLKFTHNEIGSCLKEIGGIRFAVGTFTATSLFDRL